MAILVKPDPNSISDGQWARFIFVAGRLCIDFTQTGGETGKRAYWERLHQPDDLTDWFAASPLHLDKVQASPREFQAALALREAIWRAAQAILQDKVPSAEDTEIINRAAALSDLPPQLAGLRQVWYSPASATAVLSLIARDAVDLFSSPLRARIHECENPNCGLMFVDTSRPGKRRWCLMKRCGTLQKNARRYHKE